MTYVVEEPTALNTANAIQNAVNGSGSSLFSILSGQQHPGPHPNSSVNYDAIAATLNWAYSGIVPPTGDNLNEILVGLSLLVNLALAEALGLWRGSIDMQNQIDHDTYEINNINGVITNTLLGGGATPATQALAAQLANLASSLNVETANRTAVDNAILAEERNDVAALSGSLSVETQNRTAVDNAILTEERNNVAGLQQQLNLETANRTAVDNAILTEERNNVGQLQNEIQGVGTQLTQGLQQITNVAIPAAGLAATAAAVTQLQPQISALKTETDTCLAPLCDTVTPNASQLGRLGNVLKGLEGLVDAGLLAGLLAAAVADPKGTASEVVDLTGWMSALATDLTHAVGVAI